MISIQLIKLDNGDKLFALKSEMLMNLFQKSNEFIKNV